MTQLLGSDRTARLFHTMAIRSGSKQRGLAGGTPGCPVSPLYQYCRYDQGLQIYQQPFAGHLQVYATGDRLKVAGASRVSTLTPHMLTWKGL